MNDHTRTTNSNIILPTKSNEMKSNTFSTGSTQRTARTQNNRNPDSSLDHLETIYKITTSLCTFMIVWILLLPSSALHTHPYHPIQRLQLQLHFLTNNFNQAKFLPKDLISKYTNQKAVHFTHTLPAVIWSAIIPFQTHPFSRMRYPRLHVMMGYLFLVCSLLMLIGFGIIVQRGLLFENYYDSNADKKSDDNSKNIPSSTTSISLSLMMLWFIYTVFQAIYHAKNKQYGLHQRYIIRHIASGMWVAIQRILIIMVYPILQVLDEIGFIVDGVDDDVIMFIKRNFFPIAGQVGILISVLVGEYTIYLLDFKEEEEDYSDATAVENNNVEEEEKMSTSMKKKVS